MKMQILQDSLKEHGQFLAVDCPFPAESTVGGTLASNSPGFLRWQLAHMRDMVIGMKVVFAAGTLTKSGGQVVKNVSGYDMARLHIGGLGTLGVITEVSFKLTPLPAKEGSITVGFDSRDDAFDFSRKIRTTKQIWGKHVFKIPLRENAPNQNLGPSFRILLIRKMQVLGIWVHADTL